MRRTAAWRRGPRGEQSGAMTTGYRGRARPATIR
jgi:hypothetical protein